MHCDPKWQTTKAYPLVLHSEQSGVPHPRTTFHELGKYGPNVGHGYENTT